MPSVAEEDPSQVICDGRRGELDPHFVRPSQPKLYQSALLFQNPKHRFDNRYALLVRVPAGRSAQLLPPPPIFGIAPVLTLSDAARRPASAFQLITPIGIGNVAVNPSFP